MPNMRCRVLLSSALSLYVALSSPAYGQEPYRFELQGGYTESDADYWSIGSSLFGTELDAGDTSSHGLEFAGEYFFRPVDARGGPLQEAAFLERTPSLAFSIAESRADSESLSAGLFGTFPSTMETQASEYALRYRFVAPRKPWIGIVGYGYSESKRSQPDSSPAPWGEEVTQYSIGLGRYVGARTAVTAEYGRSRRDQSPLTLDLPSLRSETLTVGLRSVLPIGTQRHVALFGALHETSLSGPTSSSYSIGSYELGVAYYPRNDVSIGLSMLRQYDAPSFFGHNYSNEYRLHANWFVTPSLAVGLEYETADSRLGFVDSFGFSSDDELDTSVLRFNFSWRR